eukprot:UN07530
MSLDNFTKSCVFFLFENFLLESKFLVDELHI